MNRIGYLGGTDTSAALGLSPWKSAHELYLEKTGQLAPREPDNPELLEFGHEFEALIGRVYARRTGYKIARHMQEQGVAHPRHPFIVGHIDYRVVGQRRGMDSKNVNQMYYARSPEWGEPGTDQVPTDIYLQGMTYLACTQWDLWDFAVLVGGNNLNVYTIERDEKLILDIEDGLAEFWEMVQSRTPPPLDYEHPRTLDLLARKYKGVAGPAMEAPEALVPWCRVFEDAKARIKREEAVADGAKARILEAMGEAGKLMLPDGGAYTRKHVHRDAYTVAPADYVTLTKGKAK